MSLKFNKHLGNPPDCYGDHRGIFDSGRLVIPRNNYHRILIRRSPVTVCDRIKVHSN
ncbi:MAG: hypothetical protein VKL20_06680 [Synechocystis sp.]|nr:hypothetical protein [Synechocystis sp.]